MGKELEKRETMPGVFEFGNNESKPVSEAVIDAVVAHTGEDPLEMDPLHSAVDPDALDKLFSRRSNRRQQRGDISVFFSFNGYEITVWSYGTIRVSETTN